MVAIPRAPRAAADVARDIRAEMTSTSSSVDALRAHLASALASALDASARSSDAPSSDELSATRGCGTLARCPRFRAVNDARDARARRPRRGWAARCERRRYRPSSSATRADLERLREASASSRRVRCLRDARDAAGGAPRAPAHDRFTASLAARIRAECDRLRAVATRLAVDAAGRTGWPPPINPVAVDAFEWDVDPSSDRSAADLCDACAVLGSLQAAAGTLASLDGDGIDPATTFESWVAEALASPVRDAVRAHFVADASPANDPSRRAALRVRRARRVALRAGARRRAAPARNRTRDDVGSIARPYPGYRREPGAAGDGLRRRRRENRARRRRGARDPRDGTRGDGGRVRGREGVR